MNNHSIQHSYKEQYTWQVQKSSGIEENKAGIHRIAAELVNALCPQFMFPGRKTYIRYQTHGKIRRNDDKVGGNQKNGSQQFLNFWGIILD